MFISSIGTSRFEVLPLWTASPIISKIVRFFHSFVDSCIGTIWHHKDFTGRVFLWEKNISPRNNLFHTQKRFFSGKIQIPKWAPFAPIGTANQIAGNPGTTVVSIGHLIPWPKTLDIAPKCGIKPHDLLTVSVSSRHTAAGLPSNGSPLKASTVNSRRTRDIFFLVNKNILSAQTAEFDFVSPTVVKRKYVLFCVKLCFNYLSKLGHNLGSPVKLCFNYLSKLGHNLGSPDKYRKVSNIRRTKCQNLDDSRLVLQLSVPNPLKPSV